MPSYASAVHDQMLYKHSQIIMPGCFNMCLIALLRHFNMCPHQPISRSKWTVCLSFRVVLCSLPSSVPHLSASAVSWCAGLDLLVGPGWWLLCSVVCSIMSWLLSQIPILLLVLCLALWSSVQYSFCWTGLRTRLEDFCCPASFC